MVYSLKVVIHTVAEHGANHSKTVKAKTVERKPVLRQAVILCATCLLCAACGVRGPLTLVPPQIKGINQNTQTTPMPAPADWRANPQTAVLFGADGKQTAITLNPDNNLK